MKQNKLVVKIKREKNRTEQNKNITKSKMKMCALSEGSQSLSFSSPSI